MSTVLVSIPDNPASMLHPVNPPASPLPIRRDSLLSFQKDGGKPRPDAKSQIRSEGELEQAWRDCERKLGGKFSTAVSKLFEPIVKMISENAEKEPADKDPAPRDGGKEQSVVERIRSFLKDDKSKPLQIDDCILWQLLVLAIEELEEDNPEPQQTLIEIVLSISPHLAFDNPTRTGKGLTIKSQCKNQKKHSNNKPRSSSRPLDMVVKIGNIPALQHILNHAQAFCDAQILCSREERRFIDVQSGYCMENSGKNLLRTLFQQKDTSEEDEESYRKRPLERLGMGVTRGGKKAPEYLKAIEILLDHDPEISFYPDRTFATALEKGSQDLVDKFLSKDALVDHFVTKDNIIKALDIIAEGNAAPTHSTIVQSLVQQAETGQLEAQVVEKLIEQNFQQLWHAQSPRIQVDDTNKLLHMAVRHQNVEFVRIFLEKYPDSVQKEISCQGKQGGKELKYPLWHNNKVLKNNDWEDRPKSDDKKTIRDMIVAETISRVPKMRRLCDIFRLSHVGELCFDLSELHPKPYQFVDFAGSLVTHEENKDLLSYESTIKFAAFPPLDMDSDDRELYGTGVREHKEVFTVLNWLHEKKDVEKIIELKVPDRLINPHDERQIADIVQKLKVESLDWRFLDMSISIFEEDVRERIHTLHLYSSGRHATISHWFSKEGLRSLPSLSYLRIHLIQEFMTPQNCVDARDSIAEQLTDLEDDLRQNSNYPNPLFDFKVNWQSWNPREDRMADLAEVAEKVVPNLSRFIQSYQRILPSNRGSGNPGFRPIPGFRPTKVAIIDNGVLSIPPHASGTQSKAQKGKRGDPSLPNTGAPTADGKEEEYSRPGSSQEYRTLWSRISDGCSFVAYDDRVSPWMFASDPHGTQMANLICAIDPGCEIYVAKVTERRHGILPRRVADAIQWAIGKDVDVISMSFAMLETVEELETVCIAAYAKGIVMLCSDHDQGANVKRAWPAEYAQTMTIAACNDYGTLQRPREEEKHKYALAGLNIPAGPVPFLESLERISGSSAATAIAAGLSSLIISCDRIAAGAFPAEYRNRLSKFAMVEKHLDAMKATDTSKYVQSEKFGNIDQNYNPGEEIDAWAVIQTAFVNYTR